MGELVQGNFGVPLSDRQKEHWWGQLESAERAVEVAKRVLGLLGIERGVPSGVVPLPYDDFHDVFPADDEPA